MLLNLQKLDFASLYDTFYNTSWFRITPGTICLTDSFVDPAEVIPGIAEIERGRCVCGIIVVNQTIYWIR